MKKKEKRNGKGEERGRKEKKMAENQEGVVREKKWGLERRGERKVRKMRVGKVKGGGGREKHYFQWTQAYIHFEAIVLPGYVDYCCS